MSASVWRPRARFVCRTVLVLACVCVYDSSERAASDPAAAVGDVTRFFDFKLEDKLRCDQSGLFRCVCIYLCVCFFTCVRMCLPCGSLVDVDVTLYM